MEQRNAITAENHNFLKDVGLGLFQHGDDQQIIINDEDVDVDNNGKVVDQVVAGDGVGWLKLSRLRKLMEVVVVRIIMIIVTIIMSVLIIKYKSFDQDENYRNMILPKLNRSLDCAGSPDDHIQDVVRPCECDADMCTS